MVGLPTSPCPWCYTDLPGCLFEACPFRLRCLFLGMICPFSGPQIITYDLDPFVSIRSVRRSYSWRLLIRLRA